jgi:hypothetical protein
MHWDGSAGCAHYAPIVSASKVLTQAWLLRFAGEHGEALAIIPMVIREVTNTLFATRASVATFSFTFRANWRRIRRADTSEADHKSKRLQHLCNLYG